MKVLMVAGHTDDEVITAGGTLAKLHDEGHQTAVAYATMSDQAFLNGTGSERAARAKKESEKALKILGVNKRYIYNFKDMYLGETKGDLLRATIGTIRHFKPDLVITHSPNERHTDHRACAKYVSEACVQAGQEVSGDVGTDKWLPKEIWYGEVDLEGFNQLNPQIIVNITDQIDRKADALAAYDSLNDEHSKLFSADHLSDYVYARARLVGLAGRVKYAEGFRIGEHLPIKIFKEEINLW